MPTCCLCHPRHGKQIHQATRCMSFIACFRHLLEAGNSEPTWHFSRAGHPRRILVSPFKPCPRLPAAMTLPPLDTLVVASIRRVADLRSRSRFPQPLDRRPGPRRRPGPLHAHRHHIISKAVAGARRQTTHVHYALVVVGSEAWCHTRPSRLAFYG